MMASPTEVSEYVDTRLKEIAAEAAFLPELVELWDAEPAASRDGWYLEWRELMARLAELDRAYRGESMSEQQEETYHEVRSLLRLHLPLLRQLALPLPSISLDD